MRKLLALAALAVLTVSGCGAAAQATGVTRVTTPPPPTLKSDLAATVSQLGSWHLIGHETQFGPSSDQGVATVNGTVIYRGDLSLLPAQAAQGWDHAGDPDAWHDDVITPYQGGPGSPAKMYLLTNGSGASYEYVHPLVPDELANNSFAAISPDGRWMVSGEWYVMDRLLVFPTPAINPSTSPTGGSLARVGDIDLDQPVNDLQGCDFITATRLLCAGDDPNDLIQVQLPGPLDGEAVTGDVTDLGSLPETSNCQGTFEPEGIDYDPTTGILRVEVSPPAPCNLVTTIYEYQQ